MSKLALILGSVAVLGGTAGGPGCTDREIILEKGAPTPVLVPPADEAPPAEVSKAVQQAVEIILEYQEGDREERPKELMVLSDEILKVIEVMEGGSDINSIDNKSVKNEEYCEDRPEEEKAECEASNEARLAIAKYRLPDNVRFFGEDVNKRADGRVLVAVKFNRDSEAFARLVAGLPGIEDSDTLHWPLCLFTKEDTGSPDTSGDIMEDLDDIFEDGVTVEALQEWQNRYQLKTLDPDKACTEDETEAWKGTFKKGTILVLIVPVQKVSELEGRLREALEGDCTRDYAGVREKAGKKIGSASGRASTILGVDSNPELPFIA